MNKEAGNSSFERLESMILGLDTLNNDQKEYSPAKGQLRTTTSQFSTHMTTQATASAAKSTSNEKGKSSGGGNRGAELLTFSDQY